MNKRSLVGIFTGAGRVRGERNAKRASKLKGIVSTAFVERKAQRQRRLTTEQVNDLKQLLGSEHLIPFAESALWMASETGIKQGILPQRKLKELHDAAVTLEQFATVLDRAENEQPPKVSEIPLFYYLMPSVAATLIEYPALDDAVLDTSGMQLRAWLEVIKVSTELANLDEKFGRRGPRKKAYNKVAISVLVPCFCRTQGNPRNSATFRKVARIVLAPLDAGERKQEERIRHLRNNPRRLSASSKLGAELAALEEQQKKTDARRDWVRKLCDEALKDNSWINHCMKMATGNNSEK